MQNTPRKSIWCHSRQKTSQYKRGFKKKAKLAFLQSGQSMILVKKLKFFHLLSLSKIDRKKNCLLTCQIKKRPLKTIKTTVYKKKAKLQFFQRGQSIVFVKKFEIFLTLGFMQNRPRKSIWERPSQRKVSIILCNPPLPLFTACHPL